MDVSLLAALFAGMLALLSPCSALLLPSFFAYAFANRTALLMRTSVFYLGLLITLVPLGVGASAASSIFYGHRPLLISVAGWTIIAIGLFQILGRSFATPFGGKLHTFANGPVVSSMNWGSTLVLGAVYGLAGFCSGPILGAILTMAATQDSPLQGGALLAVYALGMAAPLFILAVFWDRFQLGSRSFLRGRMFNLGKLHVHSTALISGLLFVIIGTIFLRFDGTAGITGMLGFGDTAGLEVSAQEVATSIADAIPLWAVPASIALIAGLVAWRRSRRRDSTATASTVSSDSDRV